MAAVCVDMEHHRKEKDSCLASESSTGSQELKIVMRTLSAYTFRVQNVTHARVRHHENNTSALVGSHMRRRLFKSTPMRMHWEELDASDCRLALQQRAQRGACGDHVARCGVHMPAQTCELQRLTRSCAPIPCKHPLAAQRQRGSPAFSPRRAALGTQGCIAQTSGPNVSARANTYPINSVSSRDNTWASFYTVSPPHRVALLRL